VNDESSGTFWAVAKVFLLARGWMFALMVLAVSIAFLWFGHVAGRLIGLSLLVGFLLIARGLGGGTAVRRLTRLR
jgi:hypothetical protein